MKKTDSIGIRSSSEVDTLASGADLWEVDNRPVSRSMDGAGASPFATGNAQRMDEELSLHLKLSLIRIQKANSDLSERLTLSNQQIKRAADENRNLRNLVQSLEEQKAALQQKVLQSEDIAKRNALNALQLEEESKAAKSLIEQALVEKNSTARSLQRKFEAEIRRNHEETQNRIEAARLAQANDRAQMAKQIEQYQNQVIQLRAELAKSINITQLWKNDSLQHRKLATEYYRVNKSLSETVRSISSAQKKASEPRPETKKAVSDEELLHTVRLCHEISSELQLLSETHPLSEYLSVTQAKLQQMERELIRVPGGHPERPQMEATVHELMDQRDRLRPMLSEARSRLQRGSERLKDAGALILRAIKS